MTYTVSTHNVHFKLIEQWVREGKLSLSDALRVLDDTPTADSAIQDAYEKMKHFNTETDLFDTTGYFAKIKKKTGKEVPSDPVINYE